MLILTPTYHTPRKVINTSLLTPMFSEDTSEGFPSAAPFASQSGRSQLHRNAVQSGGSEVTTCDLAFPFSESSELRSIAAFHRERESEFLNVKLRLYQETDLVEVQAIRERVCTIRFL